MPTRCPKCGYSNDPEFRFCGMCGSPLNRPYDEPIRPKPAPPPPAKNLAPMAAASAPQQRTYPDERAPSRIVTEERDYAPVNGPSFLGLDPAGPSSDSEPGYLLEDEETSGGGRLLLGIVLILAVGGGLFWQWQHEGYPWNPAPRQTTSSITREASDPPPAPASAPPAEATQATAQPSPVEAKPEASAEADKPAPTQEDKKAEGQPQAAESKVEADLTPDPAPKKVAATPIVAKAKRSPVPEPQDEAEPDPSEALFVDGQKYLYGSGVPEDCGRARTKLMAAANQSNSKAQSTVATMYATGHCLPRNLPSAYHWFAVALQNDRNNGRLQRDLEVIWSQMTAEEKQIALKGR